MDWFLYDSGLRHELKELFLQKLKIKNSFREGSIYNCSLDFSKKVVDTDSINLKVAWNVFNELPNKNLIFFRGVHCVKYRKFT